MRLAIFLSLSIALVGAGPDDFAGEIAKRRQNTPALLPLTDPPPPAVRDAAWAADDIDRFILARLEAAHLSPAPPADRYTLIRRLSFGLTGLPPTPDEIRAFVSDSDPKAYEKLVDRLLDSPRFGETWARHWLDLVRYAESRGHEFDYTHPNAWRYRDYVVRAFNDDLPYDRFVMEHVAGDLLPDPRRRRGETCNESILGTGWWFLNEQVHSPVDIRKDEVERIANQLEVFGKAFLALTISCARCHDHKFDAISQRDFYALAGFVKSSNFREVRFDSIDVNRDVARRLDALRTSFAPRVLAPLARAARPALERIGATPAWADELAKASKDEAHPLHALAVSASKPGRLAALVRQWRQRQAQAAAALKAAEVIVDFSKTGPDGWIVDGPGFGSRAARPGDVRFSDDPNAPVARVIDRGAAEADPFWSGLKTVASQRDSSKVSWEPAGRMVRTPTFALTRGQVYFLTRGKGHIFSPVDGHRMINGPLHGRTILKWKDGGRKWRRQDLSRYRVDDPAEAEHRIHSEISTDAADFAVYRVVQADRPPADPFDRPNGLLLEAASAATSTEDLARRLGALLADSAERLARGGGIDPDRAALGGWVVTHPDLFSRPDSPDRKKAAAAAREFIAARSALRKEARFESRLAPSIMKAAPTDEFLLNRGDPRKPKGPVARRFLEIFKGEPGGDRLALARRMVDPGATPILPRVMVNRLWHHLLGRGIVPSTDDFGQMGQPATHPKLLDHLASRFVRDGWSVKKLIRSIVLSSTYRMSGAESDEAARRDANNELWHHVPVRRITAEAVRDAMLTASGRLDTKMYGPPVPVHLDAFQDGRGRPGSGPLDGSGRRSLYLSVRRNFLSTFLLAFDFPQPFSSMGRRSVSNVPAQSLVMRNNPLVHDQAATWGRRLAGMKAPAGKRVEEMFLAAFGRPPTEGESTAALEFLGAGPGADAWRDLAHALFQAKEFIFLN